MSENTPLPTKYTKLAVNILWLTPLIMMAALIAACNGLSEKVFDNRPTDGLIEFEITFPDLGDEGMTGTLVPDKMIYLFSGDLFSSSFETVGGVFKNRVVSDRSTMTINHELKIFRKRIRASMNESTILQRIDDYPKMVVIYTDDLDTIAGFPCKKAIVVFEEIGRPEIEVYYTNGIKINSPNWCTQFFDIDGVLLAYEMEEFGVRMKLEATSIKPLPKEEALFENAPDYTEVSREAMEIELEELIAMFEL